MTSPRPTFAQFFSAEEPLLLAVAAHAELTRVLAGLGCPRITVQRDRWQAIRFQSLTVLYTGVGKANAAGSLAAELSERPHYQGVVSLGSAGSYVDRLPIGAVIRASRAVLVDEGTKIGRDFTTLEQSGWGLNTFSCRWTPAFGALEHDASGVVNTVSTISGATELSGDYARRTPEALIEDMELAALAGVCAQFGLPLCGLKIVSSYCGRPKTGDAATGLARIEQIVRGWCFPVRAGEPSRNQGSS